MQSLSSWSVPSRVLSSLRSLLDGVLPSVLVLLLTPLTLFGSWSFVYFQGGFILNLSHSRRMMMTSGSGVNYKSMFDAGSQIVAKEGTKSLFKGAGANILRGVAGAGVLSLYDKLQEVMFGKVYSGGKYITFKLRLVMLNCLQDPARFFVLVDSFRHSSRSPPRIYILYFLLFMGSRIPMQYQNYQRSFNARVTHVN